MIKDNILLIGFIVGILLMVLIVNLTQCRKPAPPEPTDQKIKTITKLKTKIQYETSIISRTSDSGQISIRANLRDTIDFYLRTR